MRLLIAAAAGLVLVPVAHAPARLGVTAKEYRLVLSRATIKPGPAIVELDNLGEDVHDLQLQRVGGTRVYSIGVTNPGGRAELEASLRPGAYRLWCSIADHRARGMRATLRVKR